MASRQFFRNYLNLDDRLIQLGLCVIFGANGAAILQRWVPPAPGVPGHYEPAKVSPIGAPLAADGASGVASIQKLGTGDFKIVLQDSYQRVKGLVASYANSKQLGTAASDVEMVQGEFDDAYPDLTGLDVERLAAGHAGTATDAAQPTFTVGSAVFPSTVIGMTFTDSAGVSATILDAASDTITLSGLVTPATGAGWTITANGTIVLNATILSGARSSTAFVPATFTVSGAGWLVNRWKGHYLKDSAGERFLVMSNTATVLTLQSVSEGANPTTGAYIIEQGFAPGTTYTVTGTAIVSGSPSGTGTANTFTPAATVNWFAGQFAGMTLIDVDGVGWFITANSTSALTVASNGSNTTPASGAWSIVAIAGGASIEFVTSTLSGDASGLEAAAQVWTGTPKAPTGTNGTSSVSGTAAAQVFTGTPKAPTGTNADSAVTMSGTDAEPVDIASGITGTSAANVFTVTAGGPTANAHEYAGMWFSDGVNDFLILDNTALTATTGTITVLGTPAGTVTAVGEVWSQAATATAQTFTGDSYTPEGTNGTSSVSGTAAAQVFTGGSYTPEGTNAPSEVTGTLTASLTPTNPGTGEKLLLTLILSDGTVQT